MRNLKLVEPYTLEFSEVDKPVPKGDEALLRLLYGGICGTDLSSYRGKFAYFDFPRTPGHEFSAEIVEIGDNNYGLSVGDIVTCNPYFNDETCYSCSRGIVNACENNQTMGVQREGAFSDYITMPIDRIYHGKGLSAEKLAIVEPFCIGWHGVQRGGVKEGDKVLVVGAGTIGVLTAISAKLKGAEVYICDINETKLKYAKDSFGLDGYLVNDEFFEDKVNRITNSNGFDVTLEAVGLASTFQNCIDAAAFGGNVVLIGVSKQKLDFDFTVIQKKELNIYGSRNALKEDFLQAIDLFKESVIDVDKVITQIYDFENAKEAFDDFDNAKDDLMLKVLLKF